MTEQSSSFTVILPSEAYLTLRELAFNNGKTETEILLDAIALKKRYDDVKRSGGRVLVERGGALTELRLRDSS
jgi:hypothetical protein